MQREHAMIKTKFKNMMKVVPIFIIFWCLLTLPTLLKTYNSFKQTYTPNNFIHISDNFDSEYETIINKKGIEQDLWAINQFLHSANLFAFGEAFFSPITIYSNTGEETQADALHIDNQAWKFFSLETQSGRKFNEADYMLTKQSPNTSIIMGSDFKSNYKTGDKISLYSTGNQLVGEVCGFLKDNSEIVMYNRSISLSSTILLPNKNYSALFKADSFDNSAMYSEAFLKSVKYDLLSRNNGIYISDYSKTKVLDYINKEYAAHQLPTVSLSAKYSDLNLFLILSICIRICFALISFCYLFIIVRRKYHAYHST